MASVVDTSVKNFNSSMPNAPVLNGTAGSFIALLDAVLKDGFDLKTLSSLVVVGGVATAAFAGSHAAQPDSVVLIAGVTGGPAGWAGLNGEQKIVSKPTTNAVTFATSLPDGTYTGTITMKMAPAGWAKPFAGPNKGVYRSLALGSTGMYVRFDDSATMVVRAVGYETMTDVDTGTNPFPSPAQRAGGGYWPKSGVANAGAVGWAVHADALTFYITVQGGVSSNAAALQGDTRGFGDIIGYRPGGDAYGCVLPYSINADSTSMGDGTFGNGGTAAQIAMPRNYTGLGSSALHVALAYNSNSAASPSGIDGSFGGFPNLIDGSLILTKKYFAGGVNQSPRGELPGFCHMAQSGGFNTFRQLDRVPGTGAFAGRTLQAVASRTTADGYQGSSAANTGVSFIDITGPWR